MRLGVRISIFWASAVALLAFMLINPGPTTTSLRGLALLIGAVGIAIFRWHGEQRVTVTGLFGLGNALIMGVGGWLVIGLDGPSPRLYTVLAATAAGLTGSVLLMSGAADRADVRPMDRGEGTFVWIGVLAMAALLPVREVLPTLLAEGAAFMSTVVLAVGVIYSRSLRWSLAAPVAVLPHLVLYAELFHGSTGRLRLVALLGCLVILYTARHRRRWHKPAMLVAAPLGLIYLARDRVAFQVQQFGASDSTGLESMLAAPRAFATLVHAQATGKEDLHYGGSFLSPLTSIVPEPLHLEHMPGIFAYELVRWTDPHLYGTEFTTAGSYFGEWWWNFGAAGIVLAVLVTGPLLGLLDRAVTWTLQGASESPRRALAACAVLAVGGAVSDLAWAGPHTWVVRGIARLPLLGLALAAVPGREPPMKRAPRNDVAEKALRLRREWERRAAAARPSGPQVPQKRRRQLVLR